MTALERAARAAYESPYGPKRKWDDLSDEGKGLAINQVRAVLMAVRDVDGFGIDVNYWSARVVDAILNEKDTTND